MKTITITLSDAEYRALEVIANSPEDWATNFVKERARISMDEIIQTEVQRKLASGETLDTSRDAIVLNAPLKTAAQAFEESLQAAEQMVREAEARVESQKLSQVSMRQARLALLQLGLLDDLENAINAIQDETLKKAVKIEWEFASDVYRNSGVLMQLAPAFGISDEQLDSIFKLASTL